MPKIWKIKKEIQCGTINRTIYLKPEQDGFCSHGWLRELCEYYPRHARLEELRSDLIKGQNDMLDFQNCLLATKNQNNLLPLKVQINLFMIKNSQRLIPNYPTDLKRFKE